MDTVLNLNLAVNLQFEVDYGLVSIIMPNYNSEKFIKDSVKSVISQTYKNWELIIVDDCSTDSSLNLLEELCDDRIRIFRNKVNSGAAASRNQAIELAQGRWIAFLDSDDLWSEDKLIRHIRFMLDSNSAFSFTHYAVLDSNNYMVTEFAPSNDLYDYNAILKHCYIGCSTVIYDSEKIGKILMPTDAIKREDFACWLKILKTCEYARCFHECLTTYRVHSASVSSNKLKMVKYQWNVYRKSEGLSLVKSIYYMIHWAILGFLKYRK